MTELQNVDALGIWQTVSAAETSLARSSEVTPQRFQAYGFNAAAFQTLAARTANERDQVLDARTAGELIFLPTPDGTFSRFRIVESSVMAPELAAKFPEIKTYRGQGIDDPTATVRLSFTPSGFQGQVFSQNGAYYIDPRGGNYIAYYKRDLPAPPSGGFRNTEPTDLSQRLANDGTMLAARCTCLLCNPHQITDPADRTVVLAMGAPTVGPQPDVPILAARTAAESGANSGNRANDRTTASLPLGGSRAATPELVARSGTQLRTYQTAIATTGEYTAFHGGTVAGGLAAVVAVVNRLNQIYEQEFAIRFELVGNNNLLIFTDSATDPYSNDIDPAELIVNQTTIDNIIGSANYDLGHLFTTSNGGLALLQSVGTADKALGGSGLPNPVGDPFAVDYVAHEIGHQFGGRHTFNADVNRDDLAAVEPGGGTTIMAYAGIIPGSNLQSNSDPFFSFDSFNRMFAFASAPGDAGATVTATGNIAPTVNAGVDITIPARTPFALTATGSDPNGDTLTYSWEQTDVGSSPQDLPTSDTGDNPIFRFFPPTTSPTRFFPRLPDILNNANVPTAVSGGDGPGELLPTTNRTLNFRVTARDNRSGGGGTNAADVAVTIVDTGVPFQVTAPNTAVTWTGNTTQTVTWNVADTDNSFIATAVVDIEFSSDGGNTFSTILLGTPNDGTQAITVPNISTTQGRIRVRQGNGGGNFFFDISDVNFTVVPGSALPTLAITPATVSQNEGNSGTTNFAFTVTRVGDVSSPSSVQFAVVGSGVNPANTLDFVGGVLPTGTVSFGVGVTTQTVTVPVQGDATVEPDETFAVTLNTPTNAAITAGTATGIILNDDAVPTLAITPATVSQNEGNSGTTNFTFTVTRAGDVSSPSSVQFAVVGSGVNPANTLDFVGGVLPTGTVSFGVGVTTQTVTVPVQGDTTVEPDETFAVTLNTPTNATITAGTATGIILNDDAMPTLAITPATVSQNEGNSGTSNFAFTVTRAGDVSSPSSVQFAVAGSGVNPANTLDFVGGVLPTGTVSFGVGVTTQTVTVPVQGDATVEPDETFAVTLNTPTNATITAGTATGIILNDDAMPTLAITPATVSQNEGNSGTTNFAFTVTRAGDVSSPSSVQFAVVGSGVNPANTLDFVGGVLPTGTVSFGVGVTTQTVTVPVQGDTTVESDETFAVTLNTPTNATITAGTATGIILNDDAMPTLAITPATVSQNEGNSGTSNFTFTVTRVGDVSSPSSVQFAVAGSGVNPANTLDFVGGVLPTGTVSFGVGVTTQTVTVPVQGDATVEPDETFAVTLNTPTNATITAGTATGIILNDDAMPTLAITPATVSQNEGNSGTTNFAFTVTRAGDVSSPSSVQFAVVGSGVNPANTLDFVGGVLPTGTVSFGVGVTTQTVTVPVQGDTTVESDETFAVTLNTPTNATITAGTATGIILNDDAMPTLAITPATVSQNEGNSGTSNFTFTVTRVGDVSSPSSVQFAVAGSGVNPANTLDFVGGVLPTGTVSFGVGVTTQTVTVPVQGDATVEPDETFAVTLNTPTNATITAGTATGIILNDDAMPTLAITPATVSQNEGNSGTTNFAFTVTRAGDVSSPSSVQFAVAGSGVNPANTLDFVGGVLPTGTVSFGVGVTTQTVTVPVQGDATVEPDETFAVTLNTPTNATITTGTATGIILNDDASINPLVSIQAVPTTLSETGLAVGTFTISRSFAAPIPLTVTYTIATGAGQATNGIDYTPTLTGTATIPANAATTTFTVRPVIDTLVEGTETLSLTLVDGPDYDLGLQVTATIAIQDVVFAPANTLGSGVISRPSLFGSIILGNNANNAIAGTTGSDTIAAFAGDDVVYGFDGNDSLDGGLGNDLLVGGKGNDSLQGSVGNDTLMGVDLATLGVNEVDVLAGGLDGGISQDRFVLGVAGLSFYVGGGNADYARIVDFEVGDILQLAAVPSQVVAIAAPAAGIGIFVGGDLVAVVQGAAATLANVNGAVTVV